ncbi:hypothetical protein CH063_10549 [Colletotrichum higginsianum]|uniref:Uncharacterized protein n=1 Tax=Colletotrichum higginsianum (strain IMI 349063) TaxID=759273 RepID=H1VHX0_COLHI|nr:hypothetical protein CH063_10549 [Colletotrichum higginsianum]
MSTVNIVKYYFHKANAPRDAERMRKMVLLAYQTAKDKKLYPKEVFIRYASFAELWPGYSGTHVACHGYVTDKESLQFIEATHAGEKPDSTKKNEKGDVVWPGAERLWAAPEIGYGHLE